MSMCVFYLLDLTMYICDGDQGEPKLPLVYIDLCKDCQDMHANQLYNCILLIEFKFQNGTKSIFLSWELHKSISSTLLPD